MDIEPHHSCMPCGAAACICSAVPVLQLPRLLAEACCHANAHPAMQLAACNLLGVFLDQAQTAGVLGAAPSSPNPSPLAVRASQQLETTALLQKLPKVVDAVIQQLAAANPKNTLAAARADAAQSKPSSGRGTSSRGSAAKEAGADFGSRVLVDSLKWLLGLTAALPELWPAGQFDALWGLIASTCYGACAADFAAHQQVP